MDVDWQRLFGLTVPPVELIVRGSVMYLGLFVLLRLVLKREAGGLGMTDLLVIVLLADAAQNGMTGDYRSITDGLLLVGTILAWSSLLDWLGYHVPWIQRWVHPAPLVLIRNGRMLRRNMRRELITTGELESALRQQGVDDLAMVREARMEGDGRISVVKHDASDVNPAPQHRGRG